MKRSRSLLPFAMSAVACCAGGGTEVSPAEVEFLLAGNPVHLSLDSSEKLAAGVRDAVATCGLNSIESATATWATEPEALWRTTVASSHIRVTYHIPVLITSWSGRQLKVSEVLLGVQPRAGMVGPVLTRSGQVATVHIKCDGYRLLALQCSEPLASHLGPGYLSNCHLVR